MKTELKDYSSTIMRMAGNIAAGLAPHWDLSIREHREIVAGRSVKLAVSIVEKTLEHLTNAEGQLASK